MKASGARRPAKPRRPQPRRLPHAGTAQAARQRLPAPAGTDGADVVMLTAAEPPCEAYGKVPVLDVRQWRQLRLILEGAAIVLAPDADTLTTNADKLGTPEQVAAMLDGLDLAGDVLATWSSLAREAADRIRAVVTMAEGLAQRDSVSHSFANFPNWYKVKDE